MRYIVELGSARLIYNSLESMTEQLQNLFRVLIYFRGGECQINNIVYRIEHAG